MSAEAEVATDSAEAASNAMSAEAAADVSKQVIEAALDVTVPNGVETEASGAENGYRVGDIVWAKIKRHPWWPGQIHDPKDGSESAAGQEGNKLLVAFFGDGSSSWCYPGQILPFVENFTDLSKESTSMSFTNAVNEALEEVSRVLDSYMTCSCVSPEKNNDALSGPAAKNAEVDAERLSLPNYGASEVFSRLEKFAKNVPCDSVLDLGVVRGWLSAFHRSKGVDGPREYREPEYIEGLEDDNDIADENTGDDVSVPLGPQEGDGDEHRKRRRQKSVNEIMAEGASVSVSPPKRRKRTPVVYVETIYKSGDKDSESSKTAGEGGSDVARSGESKLKLKAMEAGNSKDNKKKKSDKGKGRETESPETVTVDEVVSSKRKPKKMEAVDTQDSERVGEEAGDDVVMILTPRERKRSKYLSDPYTEPTGRASFKKGSDASKEMKSDGEGDRAVVITKPAEDSSVGDDDAKEGNGGGDRDGADLDLKLSSLKSKVDLTVKKVKSSKTRDPENPEAAKEAERKKGSSAKASNTEKSREKVMSEKSAAESSQAKEEGASLSLVLVFSSGFPLPSKEETLKVYSKFGRVNERETEVFVGSHSARVVFENVDDADVAFKSMASESPFGNGSMETQYLRYGPISRGPHAPERRVDREVVVVVNDDVLSEMKLIRNKLEITDAILGAYHGKFEGADREILKAELRSLAEGVEAFRERVNELAAQSAPSSVLEEEKRGE